MFANKNTPRFSTLLILLSVLLWVSLSSAQQQQETTDKSSPSSAESDQSKDPAVNRHIERLGEVNTDEWKMDLTLPSAAPVVSPGEDEFVLPDEEQDQQLQQLLLDLALNPEDAGIQTQLNTLLVDVLDQVNRMIDVGFLDRAELLLQLIQSIDANVPGLSASKNRLQTVYDVGELLIAADAALESGRILEPENDNARYYFNRVLSKDPHNRSIQPGLAKVQAALVELALESARELDFETVGILLFEASAVQEDQKLVEDAQSEVAIFAQERLAELEQKAIAAIDSGEFTVADLCIIDLIAFGGQELRVESLRARLTEARLYGGFAPGQLIVDELLRSGGTAPEIVVIAAGSYLMGSDGRTGVVYGNEKPQHRVTIERGFGLGVREVSVEEFRRFVESTGYRTAAERSGSSSVFDEAAGRLNNRADINWRYDYRGKKARPELPVLHVNLYDAQAYVHWLAVETGKGYRLPSEAEYEYVARAGGNGTYWWGEGSPDEAVENLTGERDNSPGKRQWTTSFKKYGDGHWGPAPVGSFGDGDLVHPMGVHDIAGNVSEWTEDCWHHNYIKAPVDGSAWVNPGCKRRVRRGGYWASAPVQSRAGFRISAKAETYGPIVGIRIARDL